MIDLSALSVEDRQSWDAFVTQSPEGHLLQSFGWGEFKGAFGWEPHRLALLQGERILAGVQVLLRATPLGKLAYVPRGPVVDLKDDKLATKLFEALHGLARRKGCLFLKVEPPCPEGEGSLKQRGFQLSSQIIQPRASFIVDLTADLETIAARQKAKTRYNIGLAQRKGVSIKEGNIDDLPIFYALLQETSQRDRFPIHSLEYYRQLFEYLGKNGRLLLASYEREILAGIMVAICGAEAIYLYGASSS